MIKHKCKICNNEECQTDSHEFLSVRSNIRKFQHEKFTVWKCSSCGSLHSEEDVDLDYYYKDYPLHNEIEGPFVKLGLSNRLKRLKKAGLNKEHSILDFGCGNGIMVSFLNSLGYNNAMGYDEYNSNYSDKRILDRRYDYILCQDVIEHSQEPRMLLQEMINSLNNKGIISIGTPNADAIDMNNPEKYLMSLHQPYHRHIFSESSLIQLGSEMDLNVKKVYYRFYMELMVPSCNQRFVNDYILKKGGVVEAIFTDKIDLAAVFTPKMIFYAFFGYFFSPQTEMEIIFQRS